jgi:hypothetical protein
MMQNTFKLAIALLMSWTTASFAYGQISAEEFLPPVQGGTDKVAKAEEVEVKENVVEAATAQDAINAAVEENVKQIQKDPAAAEELPETGAKWIKFKSGGGSMATGVSVYSTKANPNASRIAQRNAYVIAYTNAKAAMGKLLGQTSSEGQTVLKSVASTLNDDETVTNANSEQLDELIAQASTALMHGYVTYSVKEIEDPADDKVRYVYVTIASTPSTVKTVTRSGGGQSVDKLLTGIQNTLDEVKAGIVPPVGGRIVTVPGSGDTAMIAFGSAIVMESPNVAAQAKNKLTAQKIAGVRARDAMVGILNGDKTIWQSGVASKAATGFEESVSYLENDPTKNDQVEVAVESFKSTFLSDRGTNEELKSMRKGVLPSGVQQKNWISEDGHWAVTMVVYYPPVTEDVKKFSQQQANTELIVPAAIGQNASGDSEPPKRIIDNSVKPLKGGQVSPDDEL